MCVSNYSMVVTWKSPSHSLAVIRGESIVSCYSCVTSWCAGSVRGETVGKTI